MVCRAGSARAAIGLPCRSYSSHLPLHCGFLDRQRSGLCAASLIEPSAVANEEEPLIGDTMDAMYSIVGGLLVGLFVGFVLVSLFINYKTERLEGKVNAILKHLGIAFPPAPSERVKGIA